MSVPDIGERCWLRDWRRLRGTDASHNTYTILQESELYVIEKYDIVSRVSFKPDAKTGWLINNRAIMNQQEYYKWRKANAWRKNNGV